jgi:hypothetical protein
MTNSMEQSHPREADNRSPDQDRVLMASYCEHCIKPSGPIRGRTFLNQLSDYQIFKMGSGP